MFHLLLTDLSYRQIAQLELTVINALDVIAAQTGFKGFVVLGGLDAPNAQPGQLSIVKSVIPTPITYIARLTPITSQGFIEDATRQAFPLGPEHFQHQRRAAISLLASIRISRGNIAGDAICCNSKFAAT
jgi:hypothetical protein